MRFFSRSVGSDPTDLCAQRISNADFFLFDGWLPTTNQWSQMVAPDYHEEDGHSTASSTTQLSSHHPLRHRFQEHHGGGIDYSTVPPTPLSHRNHLLSPVRTESPSHGYNLRSTPERVAALDSGIVVGSGGGVAVSGVVVGGAPVAVGDQQRVRGGRVPRTDAIMAQADKDLEERANRAKEILSMRYKSLRQDQVRRQRFSCSICKCG
jgi:hypothetical protein